MKEKRFKKVSFFYGAYKKCRVHGASTFASTIFCVFFLFIFFMICFYNYVELVTRSNVDRIGRKYVNTMEINGYLTNENKVLLMNELQSEGMINISLEGTDFSPVGYGNIVTLSIEGDLVVEKVGTSGDDFVRKEEMVHVSDSLTGTALY